jgi:hypothetical protein
VIPEFLSWGLVKYCYIRCFARLLAVDVSIYVYPGGARANARVSSGPIPISAVDPIEQGLEYDHYKPLG